jgi:hypothetical protein
MASSDRDRPVIREPRGTDPKWQEKITRARQARDMSKSIREGKPKSFRRAVG